MNTEPYVFRTVHLAGGLRAINPPRSQRVSFNPLINDDLGFDIPSYGALIHGIESLGLKIIGIEFVSHIQQAKGIMPPEWRPWHHNNKWILFDTRQKWSEIAASAHKKGNIKCFDNARRIQSELDTCQYSLQRLSSSYNISLKARVISSEFKNNQPYGDLNTQGIFDAIHSFLASAGTLRDYISEFISNFIINGIPAKVINKRTMAPLIGELYKIQYASEPLRDELLKITDKSTDDGWLARLSEYRNIIIHQSPISDLFKRLYIWQKEIDISGFSLPSIVFPIPPDPFKIKKFRSNKQLIESSTDWMFAAFKENNIPNFPDALEYLHNSLGLLAALAHSVANYSPCKAEPIVFKANTVTIKNV